MSLRRSLLPCSFALVAAVLSSIARADDYLLAEGSWPGRIWSSRAGELATLYTRPTHPADDLVTKVQSVTRLPSGEIAFASGLDRTVLGFSSAGERRLHHGGGLVRQVRADGDGRIYWSGLETPRENEPLPDGFIYRLDPATGDAAAILTFSQIDVGKDWWGAFDVYRDKIYVGTSRGKTSLYNVSVSPVERVCELPFAVSAFRFQEGGGLLACDGKGRLFRFGDLSHPESFETILETSTPFVDFDAVR